MTTRILILFFILFSVGQDINAQPKGLDPGHRSVKKQLRKLNCSREFKLEMIPNASAQNEGVNENKQFFIIKDETCDSSAMYLYLGRVNTCRSEGCTIHYGEGSEIQYEFFDYMIVFNTSIHVEAVRVIRYEATHGQEISSKRWLKQFEGYTGEQDLVFSKEIDGITGATTSVNCISYDIQEQTRMLKKFIQSSEAQDSVQDLTH